MAASDASVPSKAGAGSVTADMLLNPFDALSYGTIHNYVKCLQDCAHALRPAALPWVRSSGRGRPHRSAERYVPSKQSRSPRWFHHDLERDRRFDGARDAGARQAEARRRLQCTPALAAHAHSAGRAAARRAAHPRWSRHPPAARGRDRLRQGPLPFAQVSHYRVHGGGGGG